MFIPIRKRLRKSEILIAVTVGAFVSMYVWDPIIRQKLKQQRDQTSNETPEQVQPIIEQKKS